MFLGISPSFSSLLFHPGHFHISVFSFEAPFVWSCVCRECPTPTPTPNKNQYSVTKLISVQPLNNTQYPNTPPSPAWSLPLVSHSQTYCKVGTSPSTTVISGTFVKTGLSTFVPCPCACELLPATALLELDPDCDCLISLGPVGGFDKDDGLIEACGWERGKARPCILDLGCLWLSW